MLSDLLNRRSLGSLNSLQEDSLATFNDAFTIYGHPKVKDVLRAFELQQCITLVEYRTANKLRCIQKKMELHRVNVADVITIIHNANLGPNDSEISEADMEPVLMETCNLQSDLDGTTVSNTDLILTWILQMFDGNYSGSVTVRRFTMALITLCNGRLLDKLTYLFNQFKDPDTGQLTREGFHFLFCDLLLIPCSVFEEESYGNTQIVLSAAYDCFSQENFEADSVSIGSFLQWCMGSPHSISWLSALHRVMSSEYTINTIPCSNCSLSPYLGFRYDSLYTYNISLCQHCVWRGCVPAAGQYREYGSLGNRVNVYVSKDQNTPQLAAKHNHDYMTTLDDSYHMILDYTKRLDSTSVSHFVDNLHGALHQVVEDDNALAFAEECEDRSAKLAADYAALVNTYRGIRELEREGETSLLELWKRYDELAYNVNTWMFKRNEQYIKQEALLRENDIVPVKLSGDTSPKVQKAHKSPFTTRVSVDDQMLVLSKLSLLVNNALLQQSISDIGHEAAEPTTPKLDDSTAPLTPIANPLALGFDVNKEEEVMKEFESVVNGIIVEGTTTTQTSTTTTTTSVNTTTKYSSYSSTTGGDISASYNSRDDSRDWSSYEDSRRGGSGSSGRRRDDNSNKEEEGEGEEEEEWISEGDWETEEEITVSNDTSSKSEPPQRLELAKTEGVSEPECDLSDNEAMPVPPPRTLLSPINSSRRATSLKTKEGDPRKDELRKAMKAPKNNSFNSGSITSRIPTPRSKAVTLENSPSPNKARIPPTKIPTAAQKKVITGPIVDEGDSDSTTSSSSSSSSSDDEPRKKRSNFTRARSARFARTKVPVPDRNAASFRNKKGTRPPPIEELGFMNRFAE